MKDYLGKARFWNAAPLNPTQTIYTRFIKGPLEPTKTIFSRGRSDWQKIGKDAMKNRYSEWLDR